MTTIERDHQGAPAASTTVHGQDTTALQYDPQALEADWQLRWRTQGLYRTPEGGGKPKYYVLDFFPYPSGDGLSVGHCRNYVPTDTLSRYFRMRGFNVLHPMGWDAFGEPTEQFAITTGTSPRKATDRNAANYKRQFDLIGCSYDWSREIDSSAPDYYHWTQWFFPAALQARAGVSGRTVAVVVPALPDHTLKSGGARWNLLAWSHWTDQEADSRLVLQNHRVRGPTARRAEGDRVA